MGDRVDDRVDDGGGRANRRGLADPFDPERVETRGGFGAMRVEARQQIGARDRVFHEVARKKIAIFVVDGSLPQRLSHALGDTTVDLTFHEKRIDDSAAVVHRHESNDLDLSRARIDLDDRSVHSERVCLTRWFELAFDVQLPPKIEGVSSA